jgi:hypothetical protein
MKRRKVRTTDSRHPYPRYVNHGKDLAIVHPNQVWVSDIIYIRLKNVFVFLSICRPLRSFDASSSTPPLRQRLMQE